jgi:hypothetical protein
MGAMGYSFAAGTTDGEGVDLMCSSMWPSTWQCVSKTSDLCGLVCIVVFQCAMLMFGGHYDMSTCDDNLNALAYCSFRCNVPHTTRHCRPKLCPPLRPHPPCPITPGPGASGFQQGDVHRGSTSWSPLASLINGVSNGKQSPQQQQCHGAKPLLLNVGESNLPYLWVPRVTEVAIVRLGNFVSTRGLSLGGGRGHGRVGRGRGRRRQGEGGQCHCQWGFWERNTDRAQGVGVLGSTSLKETLPVSLALCKSPTVAMSFVDSVGWYNQHALPECPCCRGSFAFLTCSVVCSCPL